jgi:3-oxoacyl-[acyl-carrier protein] reductase
VLRGHCPGVCEHAHGEGTDQKALVKLIEQVPIDRLIEPGEVSSLIGEMYRNEAINGETFFIHGGLRLGSKG